MSWTDADYLTDDEIDEFYGGDELALVPVTN
jgi:hypothetical protein